jgi:phosphohistidine phosphatase
MHLLTLVRHAKSSWDDTELSDFDRPLNARGERVAPEMAHRMASILEKPLQLISSPAVRALSTASIFARALDVNEKQIQLEPRIYDASTGTLLDIVQKLSDGISHAVLFGHNPGFTDLAQYLSRSLPREMPTCSVVTLSMDASHWRDAGADSARLLRFHYPKELGI